MPGALQQVGATVMCPHGAPAQHAPGNPRVLLSGMPVVTAADLTVVTGCPLNVSGAPQPCLTVRWITPATRILVNGVPPLLSASTGLCLGPTQAPQGSAIVAVTQPRVVGI